MEEQLITWETAKLAKEKGFNIKCNYHYDRKELIFNHNIRNSQFEDDECSATTQSLLQKWIRERHKIIVSVDITERGEYFISVTGLGMYGKFKTWEQALEEGLYDALKLI